MNKIFITVRQEKSSEPNYCAFELVFTNFSGGELGTIQQKLKSIEGKSWKQGDALIFLHKYSGNEPYLHCKYHEINIKQEKNLVKISRNNDSLYLTRDEFLSSETDTGIINAILRVMFSPSA